jgi:hypothetical protein
MNLGDDKAWQKLLNIAGALANQKPLAATPGAWGGAMGAAPTVPKTPTGNAAAAIAALAATPAAAPVATATAPGLAGWATAPSLFGLPRWAVLAIAAGAGWLVFRR